MINKTTNLVDMSKNLTHDLRKGDHFIFILITQFTQELLRKIKWSK